MGHRVLVVCDAFHPELGGAERVIGESAQALRRRGHDVWVVAGAHDPRLPAREDIHGVPVIRYPISSATTLHLNVTAIRNAARVVRDTIRAHGPFDALHAHGVYGATGACLTARGRALPYVSTFHGPAHREFELGVTARDFTQRPLRGACQPAVIRLYSRWLRALQARLIRRGPCVVLSHTAAEMVRTVAPAYPRDRLRLVPGGVDLSRFRPAPDRLATRSALGLPPHRPVLFAVGRIVPAKGFDSLVHALGDVRGRHPDVHLVIGGRGPLEGRLRRRVATLGLETVVTFAGALSGEPLIQHYQSADLFVLSSSFEPFGLVTLESLACGTPVLATRLAGSAEILQTLGQEHVAPEPTPRALADGITHLLDQRVDAPALRARCRALVADRYSWRTVSLGLEAVYDELAARQRP